METGRGTEHRLAAIRQSTQVNLEVSSMKPLRWLALLLSAYCTAAAAQYTATVIPANPRYLEPVYVRIDPPSGSSENIYGARVLMIGTAIEVTYQFLPEIGDRPFDVMLGRLPAGNYTVNVHRFDDVVATARFTVAPPVVAASFPGGVPAVNFTDIWWNPSEPGWGLSVHQGPTNELFAAWFTYDAAGNPAWYTLQPGQWTGTSAYSTYTGPVYKTSGPFFGGAFDPAKVHATAVGTATLEFSDASHGQFRYTVEGITGVRNIEREPIE